MGMLSSSSSRSSQRLRIPTGRGPTLDSLEFQALHSYSSKELTATILTAIAMGTIILASFAAPNLAQLLKFFPGVTSKEKRTFSRKMYYLADHGYLEKKDGVFQVAKKGEDFLSEEKVWSIKPKMKTKWDGTWHFVLFDIEGKKERARQALRARLEELGLVHYQHSVFVHHEDMREVLIPFLKFYGINTSVRFLTAKNCDGESTLRTHFKVKKM